MFSGLPSRFRLLNTLIPNFHNFPLFNYSVFQPS
ncbi:hypothetical protein JOE11_005221 [Robbsia andropogonis]